MIISNGKLILGLIPFMAYYFNDSSDPFLTYCALAGNNNSKKVFWLYFPSQVMGSAMGDTSGKAVKSFWKMSSPFEEGSSCALSQTHLHWEGSEHRLPLCHQFQTVKQEFC